VPQPPIASDFPETVHVLTDLPTQGTLNRVVTFKDGRNSAQFVLVYIAGLFAGIHIGLYANLPGYMRPYSVQIGQRNRDLLVIGNIYAK
jgi:hypothetical protein